MKKIVLLIWCLLGALCAWAGPFYSGYSQAPVAHMTSTSSMRCSSYGGTNSPAMEMRVQGFRTSASGVTGGVTSSQTYGRFGAPRRSTTPTPPPDPTGVCQCVWIYDANLFGEGEGGFYCPKCGSTVQLEDALDGHYHDYCPCPLEADWRVLIFLTALAGVYKSYKQLKKKQS